MGVSFRLFAILIVLTLLSEIIVRTVLVLPASSIPDQELGWVYKPYSTILHTIEGRAINTMNSMGFNDENPNVNGEKTQILIFGDSIVEALQVPRSENFTSKAEEMASCFDFNNVGRSGLSPVHYPTVLSRMAKYITPKLGVVVITSGDISDMTEGNYEVIREKIDKRIIGLRLKSKPLNRLRVKFDLIFSRSALANYLMQRAKALTINKRVQGSRSGKTMIATSDSEKKGILEILIYLLDSMNSKIPTAVLYIPKIEYGVNRMAKEHKQSVEFVQLIKNAVKVVGVQFLSTKAYMKASYREYGQPGSGFQNNYILGGHLNKFGHQATALALLELAENVGLRCPPMNN